MFYVIKKETSLIFICLFVTAKIYSANATVQFVSQNTNAIFQT